MAAGIFRRCAAFVLDLLLWLLLCFPMRLLLSLLGMAGIGSEAVFFHYTIADLILAAFFALYFIAFEGAFGTTPGKRVCGMRIVSVRPSTLAGWMWSIARLWGAFSITSCCWVTYLRSLTGVTVPLPTGCVIPEWC